MNNVRNGPDVKLEGDRRLSLSPSLYEDGPKAMTGFLKGTRVITTIAHVEVLPIAQVEGASGLEKGALKCQIHKELRAESFFLAGGGLVF